MRASALSAILGTALLGTMSVPAWSHATLTASTPAANTVVSNAPSIRLQFNERLIAATVKAELRMTGMPGMAKHQPMAIATSTVIGRDRKSLTVTPRRPLAAGNYQVSWSAAGADTHRRSGQFTFSVK